MSKRFFRVGGTICYIVLCVVISYIVCHPVMTASLALGGNGAEFSKCIVVLFFYSAALILLSLSFLFKKWGTYILWLIGGVTAWKAISFPVRVYQDQEVWKLFLDSPHLPEGTVIEYIPGEGTRMLILAVFFAVTILVMVVVLGRQWWARTQRALEQQQASAPAEESEPQ